MLSLAFECSNLQLAVALLKNNELLSQELVEGGLNHSELLIVKINEILEKNNINYHDLDLIIVSNGPCSFTALRVALTTAKIIKIACKKPIITVNKCESLAFFFKNKLKELRIVNNNIEIITIVSAYGQEVFSAKYSIIDNKLTCKNQPRLSNIDSEINDIKNSSNFFLFEQEEFYQKFYKKSIDKIFLLNNDAYSLGLVGIEKYLEFNETADILPIYLLEPKITIRKN